MTRQLHIAAVQFAPRKGDLAATLAHLTETFTALAAVSPRPQVIALPESALTGYFLEGGVRDVACSADEFANLLYDAYAASALASEPIDVVAGFYELHHNAYYNSALYVTLGGPDTVRVWHVHRKVFLPTYGLFDEERFVEHGFDVRAFDTPWGRAAILICEDAWHGLTATIAALHGAEVIFIPSASPARGVWPEQQTLASDASQQTPGDSEPGDVGSRPASLHRWERLARDRAEEHGTFIVVSQLLGNEAGKTFAGGSTIVGPRGDVRSRGPLWEEAILPVTIDLNDITRARADTPLLSDLRSLLPHMMGALHRAATDVTP